MFFIDIQSVAKGTQSDNLNNIFFIVCFLRHLMLIVIAFLPSENVHLEGSNGISLRQARI